LTKPRAGIPSIKIAIKKNKVWEKGSTPTLEGGGEGKEKDSN